MACPVDVLLDERQRAPVDQIRVGSPERVHHAAQLFHAVHVPSRALTDGRLEDDREVELVGDPLDVGTIGKLDRPWTRNTDLSGKLR